MAGGAPDVVLAVNLSPRELRSRECVERVRSCLERYGVPASALELELTEGVLLEDVEQCIANMRALKETRRTLPRSTTSAPAIRLTYLKRLPLDRLKIDRSFTQDLVASGNGNNVLLVETILNERPQPGPGMRGRGHRNQRPARAPEAPGVRVRPGLPAGQAMVEADFVKRMGPPRQPVPEPSPTQFVTLQACLAAIRPGEVGVAVAAGQARRRGGCRRAPGTRR